VVSTRGDEKVFGCHMVRKEVTENVFGYHVVRKRRSVVWWRKFLDGRLGGKEVKSGFA
jgi:hypothetical protein